MSREDVIRMAEQAGASFYDGAPGNCIIQCGEAVLERFAALVAAAEREACAQVVDAKEKSIYLWTNTTYLIECAAAIRARGNQ